MRPILRIPLLCLALATSWASPARNNLATTGAATSNASEDAPALKRAIDGKADTAWTSDSADAEKWITVELPGNTEVTEVALRMDFSQARPPASYAFQTYMNGRWKDIARGAFGADETISRTFHKAVLTDQIRVAFFEAGPVAVKEFEIYGVEYVADLTLLKTVLINQSGYNLGKPKRFTAPKIQDGTPFRIINANRRENVYEGIISNHVGDFTAYNPESSDEFVVSVNGDESYPFRIGPYWLERVTYQNMMDFMTGARHYVGTTREMRTFSWEWRDGDFFNWAMQSLIAQYLSNPEAYKRLDRKIEYIDNATYPADYQGLWGKLEPYKESAPDIVKLIHWDADVKLSQGLEHEHQKAELAHFLYAYPYLKEWLPPQNFEKVYEYLRLNWEKPTVKESSTTKYDRSEDHNLLSLKTAMGTNKGELPPGHSVIPNLMLYEAAKAKAEPDSEKYFDAAHRQMAWMIANLDWKDPIVTKGQRMSEHITMRAFAYFHSEYPDRAPSGLQEKVARWAEVALSRSDNMWDFRKYTDDKEWAPIGWNETGNILGFPAAALAAKSVIESADIKRRLDVLAWSHIDNAFGRNPLGRHSSFDGPKEIEGVDLGWFNAHAGGIGLLEPVPFVFDGSPKAEHYPNHPELGNIGWTEGWVQFNIAFNASMAYLAHDEVEIQLERSAPETISVRLKAPLNFREDSIDTVAMDLRTSDGRSLTLTLTEEGPYSQYLSATVPLKNGSLSHGGHQLTLGDSATLTASYGLGYFEKTATLSIPDR